MRPLFQIFIRDVTRIFSGPIFDQIGRRSLVVFKVIYFRSMIVDGSIMFYVHILCIGQCKTTLMVFVKRSVLPWPSTYYTMETKRTDNLDKATGDSKNYSFAIQDVMKDQFMTHLQKSVQENPSSARDSDPEYRSSYRMDRSRDGSPTPPTRTSTRVSRHRPPWMKDYDSLIGYHESRKYTRRSQRHSGGRVSPDPSETSSAELVPEMEQKPVIPSLLEEKPAEENTGASKSLFGSNKARKTISGTRLSSPRNSIVKTENFTPKDEDSKSTAASSVSGDTPISPKTKSPTQQLMKKKKRGFRGGTYYLGIRPKSNKKKMKVSSSAGGRNLDDERSFSSGTPDSCSAVNEISPLENSNPGSEKTEEFEEDDEESEEETAKYADRSDSEATLEPPETNADIKDVAITSPKKEEMDETFTAMECEEETPKTQEESNAPEEDSSADGYSDAEDKKEERMELRNVRRRIIEEEEDDEEEGDEEEEEEESVASTVKRRRSTMKRRSHSYTSTEEEYSYVNGEKENRMEDAVTHSPMRRSRTSTAAEIGMSDAKHTYGVLLNLVDCPNLTRLEPVQCFCAEPEGSAQMNDPARNKCEAQDIIDKKSYACTMQGNFPKGYRPSQVIPFMVLCPHHEDRFAKHHCCPCCGMFCSQGMFILCSTKKEFHIFHKECMRLSAETDMCLHCHSRTNLEEVTLQIVSPERIYSLVGVREKQASIRPSLPALTTSKLPPVRVMNSSNHVSANGYQKKLSLHMKQYIGQLETILSQIDTAGINTRHSVSKAEMLSAIKRGDLRAVTTNIVSGNFNINTVFEEFENGIGIHVAAAKGYVTIVDIFLQAGANINEKDNLGRTAVVMAIRNRHHQLLEYLIHAEADLSIIDCTDGHANLLDVAVREADIEACKMLLKAQRCADRGININAKDSDSYTPILWAAENGNVAIIKLLIEHGADPMLCDMEGNTALHWAAFPGHSDACSFLIQHGCNVDCTNNAGDTALHLCARQDHLPCITTLVAAKSSALVPNNQELFPYQCAPKDSDAAKYLFATFQLQKTKKQPRPRIERLLCPDISNGKETYPIQCVNGVDDEPCPENYRYITQNWENVPHHIDSSLQILTCCWCKVECQPGTCECIDNLNLEQCAYDKDGLLTVEEFTMMRYIFECNDACQCSYLCHNRVIQQGLTVKLQLFRTEGRGWGVRPLKDIPRGTFVCEYIGELIKDRDADIRKDDSYLFDLEHIEETYCIDACFYGNIARFINHLCQPNLTPFKVFINHQDTRFPRLVFFSNRDIAAFEELGFDYGIHFWAVKYKDFTCNCKSPNCLYSAEKIYETLEANRKILFGDGSDAESEPAGNGSNSKQGNSEPSPKSL